MERKEWMCEQTSEMVLGKQKGVHWKKDRRVNKEEINEPKEKRENISQYNPYIVQSMNIILKKNYQMVAKLWLNQNFQLKNNNRLFTSQNHRPHFTCISQIEAWYKREKIFNTAWKINAVPMEWLKEMNN